MLSYKCFSFYLMMLINIFDCNGYGRTNFYLKRFEQCDLSAEYPLQINSTIKTVNNKQYIDGTIIIRAAIDSNIRSNFTVEMLTGKSYLYLFSITERDFCRALHKYMGEFIYDLERRAQLMPGTCPMPKGRYRLHDAPLNFDKITLQTFPFGKLHFTEVAMDRQNHVFTCFVMEVDNRV